MHFPHPQNEIEVEKRILEFLTHRTRCGELEMSRDFKAGKWDLLKNAVHIWTKNEPSGKGTLEKDQEASIKVSLMHSSHADYRTKFFLKSMWSAYWVSSLLSFSLCSEWSDSSILVGSYSLRFWLCVRSRNSVSTEWRIDRYSD